MTAGHRLGFQPHPIEPSDIDSFRQHHTLQVSSMRNIFFNNTRFKAPDKKSMVKLYNNERNRNRRK